MASLGMFALAWLVGYGLCRAALGPLWRDVPATLRLGLGWAAGMAHAGMTTFWAIALAPERRELAVGLAAAAGLSLWLVRPPRAPRGTTAEPGRGRSAAWWAGAAAFIAVLFIWLAHGLDIAAGAPAGGWDAWSIWTHRARFLYLAPGEWTRGFDPVLAWSHPEYPALIPSLIAYGWLPAGRCLATAPVAVALMTQVGMLLLLVGFAQAAYPRSAWPWAFGVFYATIPLEWTQEGAWQYADRPLGLFLLAGAGCLALAVRQRRRPWLFLAGFFWGAAAFTKDEGKAALVVLCAFTAFATLSALCHGGGWRAIGHLVPLALGLAPGVGSLALQRDRVPFPLAAALAHDRHPTDRRGPDGDDPPLPPRPLHRPRVGLDVVRLRLALTTLALRLRRRELWLLWIIPAAQLAIYLLIFQLTPEDLSWHLDSAMPRLLFHVAPLAFLAAAWLVLEAQQATFADRPAGRSAGPRDD